MVSVVSPSVFPSFCLHYGDVIMNTMASQITSLTIVYSTIYSGAVQRKHQSSASQAFVRWIHRGPVNSPHKWPVTRKMFPFDDVIMICLATPVQYQSTAYIRRCVAQCLIDDNIGLGNVSVTKTQGPICIWSSNCYNGTRLYVWFIYPLTCLVIDRLISELAISSTQESFHDLQMKI